MRRYLVFALAALALALVAPSSFAAVVHRHVIFDPPASPTPCLSNAPCNIFHLNQTYVVSFVSCALDEDQGGLPPAATHHENYNWCLWMNNVATSGANKFTFTFSMPDPDASSGALDCDYIGSGHIATNDCPSELPDVGDPLTVSFFLNPALANNFYLYTDFAHSPGTATVTLAVPEPGELGLFGLGLLAIGAGFAWQHRRKFRGDERA